MNPSIDLVRVVQQEREAQIKADRLARLARLAARVRACCDPTILVRFVHVLRGSRAAS